MAKNINSKHAYEIWPLICFERIRSSYYSRCLAESVDLHLACTERQRSINRGFGSNQFLFHITFFELQLSSTDPDSWVSGRLYSLDNAGGEPFRKACITVRLCGLNRLLLFP
jgi:hypothetical protein